MTTFNDLFTIAYATPCGVQLGESFVKRPSNIGAGEWIDFWKQCFEYINSDDLPFDTEEIETLREENDNLEDEVSNLEDEVSNLEDEVSNLEKRIEELENDLAEANYHLGQKFGDQI